MQTIEGRELFAEAKEHVKGSIHEEELFPKPITQDEREDKEWINNKMDEIYNDYLNSRNDK